MKLLESSKKLIDKDKDGKLVSKIEVLNLILMHCNLVNNVYQQASKVLFKFVPNTQFGQLIPVETNSPIMIKTLNAEFSFIEIYFTNQNNLPLEIEDDANIGLVIGNQL